MNDRMEIQREIEAGLSRMRRDLEFESHVAGYLTTIFITGVFAVALVIAVIAEKLG